jgi:hypothetical protein
MPSIVIVPLFFASIFLFIGFYALRTGTVLGRYGVTRRQDSPFLFWVFVTVDFICAVYMLNNCLKWFYEG